MESASNTNTLSTSSLHHLIASVSIKLKPSNYLIWRTQILQLIQVMRLAYLIKDEPKAITTDETTSNSDKSSGTATDRAVTVMIGRRRMCY